MKERIKIAQIGITHEHAPKIKSLELIPEDFEIVGLFDDTETSHTPKFPSAPKVFQKFRRLTLDEILNNPSIKAVTVEVPNNELVPIAMRCMEHGKAIHMDKPAGEDLRLYGKLLEQCEAKKIPFQMGFMFRDNPAMNFCKTAFAKGWLGEIFSIEASMNHNYGGSAYQEYLGNLRGGIMYNLGCHFFDFIVSLLGRPENVTPFLKSTGGQPHTVKNNCVSILEYPNATATVRACSCDACGVSGRRLRICGTGGTIELSPLECFGEPLKLQLTLVGDNSEYKAGTHTVVMEIQKDRYAGQFHEFAKIIRGEMENPYTCKHDYLVHEVTLAASGYNPWR